MRTLSEFEERRETWASIVMLACLGCATQAQADAAYQHMMEADPDD